MSAELIDSIIDEGKIKTQLDNLDAQLVRTTTTLSGCAAQAKSFSDQFANSKGINEIVALTEKYNQTIILAQKAQNDLSGIEKARAQTQLTLQKAQESNAKTELLNAQAASVNAKAQADVDKATKIRIDSEAKAAAQAAKSAQAEQELTNAKQALINILTKEGVSADKINMTKSQALAINKLVVTANNAEKGSREQLAAEYELNYKAFSKLSGAQQDTTSGKVFQKSIEDQSKAVKGIEGPLGNFTRNVGNYKDSILSALGANQGFIGNLANMAMGAEKTGSTFAKEGASGVKAFGTAMKELLMNPIVATLAAIAAIFMLMKAAIDSNGEATNKLNQVLAPFKTILAFILQLFSDFVTVLLDGVLVLEKFANVIMSVIPGLDKLAEKNLQAIELEKQKQALAGKSRQLMVDEARTHEQTTELMTKARQKDRYSIQERLAFMQQADAGEISLNKQKVEHAQQTFELIKKEMENEGKTYSELTSEKKDTYMKAQADIYSIQEEYFAKTRRLHTQESALELEAQKDYLDRLKDRSDAEIEEWKASQNVASMNANQKITFEKQLADKVMASKATGLLQELRDAENNNKKALVAEQKSIADKYQVKNDAIMADSDLSKKEKVEKINNLVSEYNDEIDLSKKKSEQTIKIAQDKIKDNARVELAGYEESKQAQDEAQRALNIALIKLKSDTNLEKLKADSNYNQMTYEQKKAFDKKYFEEEQKTQYELINLSKKTDTIKDYERSKLRSESELFRQEQYQQEVQYLEKEIGAQMSFSNSQVKVDEDYGNKSLAYQQHITRELFEIQASADENLVRLKYQNNSITITELNTTLNNIKAQRAQLLEAQKQGAETDEHTRDLAAATQIANQKKKIQDDLYLNGKISASDYEKEIQKISTEGAEEQIAVEIWLDKEKLLSLKEGSAEYIKIEQDLIAKEESLDAKKATRKIQAEKELQKKIVELIKTTASAIQTIGDDQYQAELDRISSLKTANSDAATAEKDAIAKKYADGILTKTEADAQSAAIDVQKAARDKQLTDQENITKRKQAVFDKEMSAFNIGISTAEAIMGAVKAFPLTAGMPFAAVDAAIGAVQLLAVLAKPLPAYAFGTENHPGGDAVVGDGFKHELALTPGGKIIKTPDVPTVMSLPAHTKVFPDFDMAIQDLAISASLSSMHNSIPSIEINAYNDSKLNKNLGSLIVNTKNQTSELSGRLQNLDRSLSDIARSNNESNKILKGLKKNPWVS